MRGGCGVERRRLVSPSARGPIGLRARRGFRLPLPVWAACVMWVMWALAWDSARFAQAGEVSAAPAHSAASVLLITLDTTRFDHLGCYGYGRPTSPEIDLLARESLRFERVYSTSSWTLPAHASLLTGRAVSGHGAHYDEDGPLLLSEAFAGPAGLSAYRVRGLDAGVPNLASVLHARGYRTAAVIAGPWLKALFGLASGFDSYDDSGIDELNGRSGEAVTDAALAWLAGSGRAAPKANASAPASAERPFFLFLNYFDAHYPYRPPPDLRNRFLRDYGHARPEASEKDALITRTVALYDAEIRAADRAVGRLLSEADRHAWLDDAWIVLTADHGELLGEHGLWAHGKSLSEPEIRVPLLLRPPRDRRLQLDTRAALSLLDVMPTLLAQLGIEAPAGMQGRAIGSGDPSALLAEFYPLPVLKRGKGWRVWIDGRWKFVEELGVGNHLYDLQADPGEQRDRVAELPARAAALSARMNSYRSGISRPRPDAARSERPVDEATRRALQALGYLQGDGGEASIRDGHGQEARGAGGPKPEGEPERDRGAQGGAGKKMIPDTGSSK